MTVIHVPKPPASAMNKDRPISSLLKTQVEHLQQAEFRLPANMQTNIYINAIKTEGEAADYIRQVTQRLHEAHGHSVAANKKPKARGARGLQLAAVAERKPATKGSGKSNAATKATNKTKKKQ